MRLDEIIGDFVVNSTIPFNYVALLEVFSEEQEEGEDYWYVSTDFQRWQDHHRCFIANFLSLFLKIKCIGSYLDNHLQKNLIGAPLDSSGSVDLCGITNFQIWRGLGKVVLYFLWRVKLGPGILLASPLVPHYFIIGWWMVLRKIILSVIYSPFPIGI